MNSTIAQFAMVVIWSGFILWTIRKLWRSSNDLAKAEFYAVVKLGSLLGTIVSSLLLSTVVDLPALPYWQEVVYWIFSLFPVMIWCMYFGYRLFLAIVARQD